MKTNEIKLPYRAEQDVWFAEKDENGLMQVKHAVLWEIRLSPAYPSMDRLNGFGVTFECVCDNGDYKYVNERIYNNEYEAYWAIKMSNANFKKAQKKELKRQIADLQKQLEELSEE